MQPAASEFVLFAYLASGRGRRAFHPHSLCEWLKLSQFQCDQVLSRLERLGLFERVTDGEARLTDAGMVLGSQIRGEPRPGGSSPDQC
jgi:Mn-dependent DtxR family transcriptional regulator